MEQPTEAQVKEFWERCGWRHTKSPNDYIARNWWTDPLTNIPQSLLPPIDLKNLFKYAVPKILGEYNIESYNFKQFESDGKCWYYAETNIWKKGSTKHNFEVLHDQHIAKNFQQGENLDETAALALFWAILEVSKGE